ncbi:MAG: hypothetical protein AAF467_27690 [Actinomycetota bacterium]
MSTATICDFCDERITDQTSGPDGSIKFDHRSGGDREPEWISDTIHFHRRCLDAMRSGLHRHALPEQATLAAPQ